jgi:hypothetical protein
VFTYKASQVLARTDTPVSYWNEPGVPFEIGGEVLYPGTKLKGVPAASGSWEGDRSVEYEFVVTGYNYPPAGEPGRFVTGIIVDPETHESVALNFPLAKARRLTETRVSA